MQPLRRRYTAFASACGALPRKSGHGGGWSHRCLHRLDPALAIVERADHADGSGPIHCAAALQCHAGWNLRRIRALMKLDWYLRVLAYDGARNKPTRWASGWHSALRDTTLSRW